MSNKHYEWKRFWCPRSGRINLDYNGYLWDPEGEWGKVHNPNLVSLEEIADIPCLILLGEPGIGKSDELEKLKDFTEKELCKSSQVLNLNLRSCTNLKEYLFKDETFTDWLGNSYHLYLFLDSLDEGLLSIPNLATGLIDELKKSKYQNHISRLHLRLACRTFVFPEILEVGLKDLWEEANFQIYELAPLRRVDVINAAKAEGFSSDDFLGELGKKDIVPLAIKPITLKFLLNIYHRHNGQFLPNQKLYELYLEGCQELCTESKDEERHPLKSISYLVPEKRLIVAARIAIVTVFSKRFAVWSGKKAGMPDGDIFFSDLCYGHENVKENSFEITDKVIKEVLDTGLFSSRGSHRMGWAHQTYAEFLAAWYLKERNLPLSQILSLILHVDGRVVPQLQETTAWLASMRSDVFQKIMETDPDVLLQSDLASTSEADKIILVETLLDLHDQERLAYNYQSTWVYKKLEHSNLSDQLRKYICDCNKSVSARNTAIDIAETCNLVDLGNSLADIACNIEESNQVRLNAAIAVSKIGNEVAKSNLKPLATLMSQNSFEDELKGCGLRAVWPQHMTAEEVFKNLSQPRSEAIGGRYQDFIAQEFGKSLSECDLLLALTWLEQQPTICNMHYPFNALSDTIILKAWDHLANSEILSKLAQIALARLSQYDKLVDYSQDEKLFRKLVEEDDFKRRRLLEVIISIIPESVKEPLCLSGYSTYSQLTPLKQDFFWLVERLQVSNSEKDQRIYAKLINYMFRGRNWESLPHPFMDLLDCLLLTSQTNSVLREELDLEPIELDSPKADKLKATYLKHQELLQSSPNKPPLLSPPPKERVLAALSQFENGTLDSWPHLCLEMTLLPTSTHYNAGFEVDITTLPGWQDADEVTKLRIIAAAKKYIYQGEPETDAWLGTNSFRCSALSGYKALRLIALKDPDFISTIAADVWQKWAAIILDFPNAREDKDKDIRQQLIKRAYQNAPNELIRALIILIEQENTQHGSIHILYEMTYCWDERLADALFNKLQDGKLKPGSIGDLLKELLINGEIRAKDFAESLVSLPHPADGGAREKAIIAAKTLMLYSEDAGWEIIWSAIQQDPKFGQEVLEAVSYVLKYEGSLEQRLKEKCECIADLYIFLARQYPYSDKSKDLAILQDNLTTQVVSIPTPDLSSLQDCSHDTEFAIIEPEDSIRIWQDYIPQRLQALETREACDALRKMIRELPALKDHLQWRLLETEDLVRRKTWIPLKPEQLFQLISDQNKRLVQSGEDLINLLIESFDRLELELQGETPAVRDLWDKNGKDSFRPLDENAFSDYVKRFLDRDLKSRGIIVNREVEIRRSYGGNPGERTDIHVDAVIKSPNRKTYDSITVIIEVKGCWHSEVKTAMRTQLLERYLADNSSPYGLYLVGWFQCPQWDSKDSRKGKVPKMRLDEAREYFNAQAIELASSSHVVRAFVLNTALR